MSQILIAEYDEKAKTLRLAEPLAGIEDHASVEIVVNQSKAPSTPWAHLEGSLSGEAGDSFVEAIEAAFGPVTFGPNGEIESNSR